MVTLESMLKKAKEEMVIGALGGFIATIWLKSTGADLSLSLQSVGIVDTLLQTTTTASQLATTKVGILFIVIGIIIGFIVGNTKNPLK